jgi:hypothetical protein
MRGSRTGAVLDRARPRDERAVTNAPTPTAQSLEATDSAAGRRFRTASRNRARIAAGLLLSVAAVSAVLLVFDNLDKRVAVLQVTRDVLAGEQVAAADLRVVEVSVDADVTVTPVDQQVLVVGSYAKVRIVAGALIAPTMLQPTPLVGPDAAVVAITLPAGESPVGLRERSQLLLVFPPASTDAAPMEPIRARVVSLPIASDSITGVMSMSVEVAAADAPTVAAAAQVRVVLLEPGVDAATDIVVEVSQ